MNLHERIKYLIIVILLISGCYAQDFKIDSLKNSKEYLLWCEQHPDTIPGYKYSNPDLYPEYQSRIYIANIWKKNKHIPDLYEQYILLEREITLDDYIKWLSKKKGGKQ